MADFCAAVDNGDEEVFYKHASPHLHLAMMLALWTGQRQGDLINLPGTAYDGAEIRLTQSKTKSKVKDRKPKRVIIPVGAPLKVALDALMVSYDVEGKSLPATSCSPSAGERQLDASIG